MHVVEINFAEGVVPSCTVGSMRDINALDNEHTSAHLHGHALVGRESSPLSELMMGFSKSNGSKGSFTEHSKYDHVEQQYCVRTNLNHHTWLSECSLKWCVRPFHAQLQATKNQELDMSSWSPNFDQDLSVTDRTFTQVSDYHWFMASMQDNLRGAKTLLWFWWRCCRLFVK